MDNVTLNMLVAAKEPQRIDSLMCRKIKEIAQRWEELLFVTGEKLELLKCFWVPIV